MSNDTRRESKKTACKKHLLNNAVDGKMRANSNTHTINELTPRLMQSHDWCINFRHALYSIFDWLNRRIPKKKPCWSRSESNTRKCKARDEISLNELIKCNCGSDDDGYEVTGGGNEEFEFEHFFSSLTRFIIIFCSSICLSVNLDWIKVMPFSTPHFFFSFHCISPCYPGRIELMPLHAHVILIETMLHDVTDFGLF